MRWLRKRKQTVSTVLIVSLLSGNMASVPVYAQTLNEIGRRSYRAEVSMEQDTAISLWKYDRQEDRWNTTAEKLVPGTSAVLGEDGIPVSIALGRKEELNGALDDLGAAGIMLDGDITGVKSIFTLPEEIVCLGAGLEMGDEIEGTMVTVVDTIPVTANTMAALPNPGVGDRNIITASGGVWADLLDTATAGSHATRNWIYAHEDKSNDRTQWGYIFGNSLSKSKVFYRLNRKGMQKPELMEVWIQPDKSYAYTMVQGKTKKDFGGTSAVAGVDHDILENSERIQAVYDGSKGILAFNKWDDTEMTLENPIGKLTLKQPGSTMMQYDMSGFLTISVTKPLLQASDHIEFSIALEGLELESISDPEALAESNIGKEISLKFDTGNMGADPVVLKIKVPPVGSVGEDTNHLKLVRGDRIMIEKPEGFSEDISWTSRFLKEDGTTVNNSGYREKRRELLEGETDGFGADKRFYGPTSAAHLASVEAQANGSGLVEANGKGVVSIIAEDNRDKNKKKIWSVEVLWEKPENLPEAAEADYQEVRTAWKELLIGSNLQSEEEGQQLIDSMNEEARKRWNSYEYKGQANCTGIPWPDMEGATGNPDLSFYDDAVQFRGIVQNILTMAKAYQMEGGTLYQNQEMKRDMFAILDWFTANCYTIKSQTDNWWTWEIGIPKDLLPALVLLYDDLSEEQKERYTKAMCYFQPNPYYQGAGGTSTTHVGGYRAMEGANLLDNAVTAMGLGVILENNEYLYLASKASSEEFVIQTVEDSTAIAGNGNGYASGFYDDGSYLDHSNVPYLGSYGLDFFGAGVSIASLLNQTPWQYGEETIANMDHFVLEGYGTAIYNGLMLDFLKGRSVARKGFDSRRVGHASMVHILRILESLSEEAQEKIKPQLKYWMEADPAFIESLKLQAEHVTVHELAQEIITDESIEADIAPLHKSLSYMDRAVHRTEDYLFALSMYSARIKNCEVINSENKYGWHQGDGMTYLYDEDTEQYTEDYWTTVNPMRLAGTTVVPVNIGNGEPDGSGIYGEGDYLSKEHWVGGSSIGNYGISGMSLSGDVDTPKVTYAPDLRAKKSWFMFGEEIVCLGAGITNKGQDLPVETTVENRKIRKDASNVLTVNGETVELDIVENDVAKIVDGTADTQGALLTDVSWAHLEGNAGASQFGYYFPQKNQQVSVRKVDMTGNWSNIAATTGETQANHLEMWMDHGVNPEGEAYEYVLLPEKSAQEVEAYAYHPDVTILANTPDAQAVYNQRLKITGINFWNTSACTVADITSDGEASVMVQELEDGLLHIAVSDPTMRNTESLQIVIDRPVSEIVSCDENVDAELTKTGGVRLTIATKGTNGKSSAASVKLKATIEPAAVMVRPGEQKKFEVHDFADVMGDYTWSVTGNQKALTKETQIQEDGTLTVGNQEKNGSLTVSAVSSDGFITLRSRVSLGGDMSMAIPEEIADWQKLVQKAELLAQELDSSEPLLQAAVCAAVDALKGLDNEELALYSMDVLVRLEELYVEVQSAKGYLYEKQIWLDEGFDNILTGIDVEGSMLNIRNRNNGPETVCAVTNIRKATDSNMIPETFEGSELEKDSAVGMDISLFLESGSQQTQIDISDVATTSNADSQTATKSNADGLTATGSNANGLTATGSDAEEHIWEIWLTDDIRLSEESSRLDLDELDAPVRVHMNIPDGFHEEDYLVLYRAKDGKFTTLEIYEDQEKDQISFILTKPGQIILVKFSQEHDWRDALHKAVEQALTYQSADYTPDSWRIFAKALLEAQNVLKDSGSGQDVINEALRNLKAAIAQLEQKENRIPSRSNSDHDSPYFDPDRNWTYANGYGWSYTANGRVLVQQWALLPWKGEERWYYFDEAGFMKTGWLLWNGDWYYLDPAADGYGGKMLTGWQLIHDKWYYFNEKSDGRMGAMYQKNS